jgi:HEAT repeat protein
LGELDSAAWATVQHLFEDIGSPAIEALKSVIVVEEDTAASERAAQMIVACGAEAATRLVPLVSDSRWYAQRQLARILGRVAAPSGVPLLRQLLRQGDPRVVPDAVLALCAIQDNSAAQAIHTVLRTNDATLKQLVIGALVALRDDRAIPTIARMLHESRPLGKDHQLVLDMLGALGVIRSGHAVPVLAEMSRRRAVFRRARLIRVKRASVAALVNIGGADATAALRSGAREGDRLLKRLIAGMHVSDDGRS